MAKLQPVSESSEQWWSQTKDFTLRLSDGSEDVVRFGKLPSLLDLRAREHAGELYARIGGEKPREVPPVVNGKVVQVSYPALELCCLAAICQASHTKDAYTPVGLLELWASDEAFGEQLAEVVKWASEAPPRNSGEVAINPLAPLAEGQTPTASGQ